ncbi:hypothetical protein [Salipiger sp.]|uniref:hypothetical protein n=1 Tax=Salipiger sp. TaxID=2078585 RepID=UPI003A9714AA
MPKFEVPMPRASSIAALAAAAILSMGLSARQADAASISVVSDVNTVQNGSGNYPIFSNILGTSDSVLFSRNVGQFADLSSYYATTHGATVTSSSAALTGLFLSGYDLLVLTANFGSAFTYTASELLAIADFSTAGGDILMIAEANTSDTASLDSYNSVLSAVGSSIRFSDRIAASANDTALAASDISAISDSFSAVYYNNLTGGRSIARDGNGNTFLAYERLSPVPLPAGLPLLAAALASAVVIRRRRAA